MRDIADLVDPPVVRVAEDRRRVAESRRRVLFPQAPRWRASLLRQCKRAADPANIEPGIRKLHVGVGGGRFGDMNGAMERGRLAIGAAIARS